MDHDPVPWELGGSAEFDDAWAASFEETPLADGRVSIEWTCPRCSHRQAQSVERGGDWVGLDSSDNVDGELLVKCECPLDHESRPNGEVGCGYRRVFCLGVAE